MLDNARKDELEAVIIALPLHLHAPAAIAAMRPGLHVITEKLMGHSVHECKEMARVAQQTRLHLATGHQRHYNILYANAMDKIQRGMLGDLHYIRAQWHRSNLPGNGQLAAAACRRLAKAEEQAEDVLAGKLLKQLDEASRSWPPPAARRWTLCRKRVAQIEAQIADDVLCKPGTDGKTSGRSSSATKNARRRGYDRPAIEELIRWRLWDRTGAGLDGRIGQPPARRRQHLHFGDARRR